MINYKILLIEDCQVQATIYKNAINNHFKQDLVIHLTDFDESILDKYNFKIAIIDHHNVNYHNPVAIKKTIEKHYINSFITSADINDNVDIGKNVLIKETIDIFQVYVDLYKFLEDNKNYIDEINQSIKNEIWLTINHDEYLASGHSVEDVINNLLYLINAEEKRQVNVSFGSYFHFVNKNNKEVEKNLNANFVKFLHNVINK